MVDRGFVTDPFLFDLVNEREFVLCLDEEE